VGDLTAHFSRWEFASPDGLAVPEPPCRLLGVLEAIRALAGRPVVVISGGRSQPHNRLVGGVSGSFHLRTEAADIEPGLVGLEDARRCGAGGCGLDGDGWVVHVDVGPEREWTY
jgi:uncharacterized protein YcbK (DUF882 family)